MVQCHVYPVYPGTFVPSRERVLHLSLRCVSYVPSPGAQGDLCPRLQRQVSSVQTHRRVEVEGLQSFYLKTLDFKLGRGGTHL